LVRFAGVLTGDAHLAQDLTQDALVRAHARWGRIGRMDRPDLYLRRMITNGFLSRRQRAVLVLRFYESRTDDEIAAILGCSPGTVRSHVSRALAGLRERVHVQPITREVSGS
jgi:DNA-directed RNA polymerase specialized sigma24 family protein